MDLPGLLPQAFYLRPAAEVAPDLLGMLLVRDGLVLRITEVEAYGGPEDSASHCRAGRTARNAAMWEAGGCAYVFRCYGLHHMLNIVTGGVGEGAAVLVRACEPLEGLEVLEARRWGARGTALLAGPGRVAQALGVDLSDNRHPLFQAGGLELRRGEAPDLFLRGPRVGIDYAAPRDRRGLLRFAAGDTPWISRPEGLRPMVRRRAVSGIQGPTAEIPLEQPRRAR